MFAINKKRLFTLILLFYGLFLHINYVKTNQLIPRDVLFGNHAKKFGLSISWQGDMLAYLAPVDNVINIWVRSTDDEDDRPITHDTDRGIHSYYWSMDGKHIFYVQDQEGNENWRLYSVSLDDGSIKDYTPFDNVQARLIEYIKEFPDRMILGINKRDPKAHDAYELDIITGELKLIEENSGKVINYYSDTNLNIIGKLESLDEGGYKFFIRTTINDPWKELGTWLYSDGPPTNIYFSQDNNFLFMCDSRFSNTKKFIKIDLQTNEIIELASDPDYDINGGILTYWREPLVINYMRDRQSLIFFDEKTKSIFSELFTFDEGEICVLDRTQDNSLWVVAYIKDNGPVAYWLYNTATHERKFLFYNQPIFKNYTLSHMEPIQFYARDGRLIHAYLTCPCGLERKNLPLILNVHGGPRLRDA